MSIAENLIKIIEEKAKEYSIVSVKRVFLKIGKLIGVVPNSLIFAFEVLSKGTIMESAVIDIEEIDIKGRCPNCNEAFLIENLLFICPRCSTSSLELITGTELLLESIEGE